MEYMSVKEASHKWGISERRVRTLCESGRIEGVSRCGNWVWGIPVETQRPADGRTLRYIKNRSLRTGTQDYSVLNSIQGYERPLSEVVKVAIISDAFAFAGNEIRKEKIADVISLKVQNFSLEEQVMILCMNKVLSNLPQEISEKTLCDINKALLYPVSEVAGKYFPDSTKKQEVEAMLGQYAGAWSVLHPVARAAFLFSEVLRIRPFVLANEQTAFAVLTQQMKKAGLPPATFGTNKMGQLKASLATIDLRGNSQNLISMLIEAITE
ncbi:MAG: helix-turn-helix domain-containing protein [Sphaerochaetaceae bacterium]|nr:helix-turn-helix domain-containing protein [Sphaerochaetaceae bacterium]